MGLSLVWFEATLSVKRRASPDALKASENRNKLRTPNSEPHVVDVRQKGDAQSIESSLKEGLESII